MTKMEFVRNNWKALAQPFLTIFGIQLLVICKPAVHLGETKDLGAVRAKLAATMTAQRVRRSPAARVAGLSRVIQAGPSSPGLLTRQLGFCQTTPVQQLRATPPARPSMPCAAKM
jgi:hypothetical protein